MDNNCVDTSVIKGRKVYPLSSYYSRNKEYRRSNYIASFLILMFFIAVILAYILLSDIIKIVNLPPVETIKSIPVAEGKINNQLKFENSRKILADYSDFVIYYTAPVIKKEEIKEEKKKIVKKVAKPVVVPPVQQKEEVKEETPIVAPVSEVTSDAPSDTGIAYNTEEMVSNAKEEAAARIFNQMERYKRYPKQARRIGAEGIAKITFSLNTSGVVTSIKLTSTSGNDILDNAAISAAEKIVGFQAVVDNSYNKLLEVTVPVDFYLK